MRERFKKSRDRIVTLLLIAAVLVALGVAMTFANPFANSFGANLLNNGSGDTISVRLDARVDDGPVDNGTAEDPVKVNLGQVINYEFVIENSGDDYFAFIEDTIVDIWSNRTNAYALTDTHDFYVWGDDGRAMGMGIGTIAPFPVKNPYLSPSSDQFLLADGEYVIDVQTVEYGVMVLTNQGNAYSWGTILNNQGVLANSDDGRGSYNVPTLAHKINHLNLESISLYNRSGVGIDVDKKVYSWGNYLAGGSSGIEPKLIPQLSPGSPENLLNDGEYVVEIVHGGSLMAFARTSENNFYVLSDGNSYFYAKPAGVGQNGLNGQPVVKHPFLNADSPQFILDEGERFVRVINVHGYSAESAFIAVTDSGKVYQWGNVSSWTPQPWKNVLVDSFVPVRAEVWETSFSGDIVDIIPSGKANTPLLTDYVLTSDGNVYEFGYEFGRDDYDFGPIIDGFRLNEELSGSDKIISFYTRPLVYVFADGAIYQRGNALATNQSPFQYLQDRYEVLTELPLLQIKTSKNFQVKMEDVHSFPTVYATNGGQMYVTDHRIALNPSGISLDVNYSFANMPNGDLVFSFQYMPQTIGEFTRTMQLIDHTTGEVFESTTYHIVEPPEGTFTLMFTDADDNPLRDAVIYDTKEHETVDFWDYLYVEGFIPGYEYTGLAKIMDGDWEEIHFDEGESELSVAELVSIGIESVTFQFARNDWHEVQLSFVDDAGSDIGVPVLRYVASATAFELSPVGWLEDALVATHYSLDGGDTWIAFHGSDDASITVHEDMHIIVRFGAGEEPWEPTQVPVSMELGKIFTLTEGSRLDSSSTFMFHFEQVTPDHPAYEVWVNSNPSNTATAQRAQIDPMSLSFSPSSEVRFAEYNGHESHFAFQMETVNPLTLLDRPTYEDPYVFVVWEEIGDDPAVTFYAPLTQFYVIRLDEVSGNPVVDTGGEWTNIFNGFAPTPQHTENSLDYADALLGDRTLDAIWVDLMTNVVSEEFDNWLFFLNETAGATDELQDNQLDLTKNLRMNEGTVWDGREDFLFEIEGLSVNGNTDIAPPTVASPLAMNMDEATEATAAGVTTLTKSVNLFEGMTFDRAGIFTYRVTEVAGDSETITYDETTYEVDVFVRMVAGSPEVESVTVYVITDERTKVETLEFTNEFWEVTDFTITKIVSGTYADPNKEFDITVSLVPTPIWNDHLDDVMSSGQWTWNEAEGIWSIEGSVSDGFGVTTARSLPVGAAVTVTEADYSADGYTTWINGQQTQSLTIALAADDANLFAIENVHELLAPTGIFSGAVPWFALAVLVIGALYVVSRRRRSALDEV